ncbi:hypothetical protein B566_EDAN015057 [Ephemera danica]|nr:hypothetical protein B566_EDAN015057 [Ephemera danica]
MDEAAYKQMTEAGIDELLAQHIAHLFIRDSNIQSTNWQTMRFKPPPPYSPIGWRVEFRPCEAQLTDFENAAIVCFVVLLTRTILSFQLNLLIPISKVDENMQRAQMRDAVRSQKFWFRKDVTTGNSPSCCQSRSSCNTDEDYLSNMDVDADTHCTIQQYLKLIQRRASGELLTTARWLREQVLKHPEYSGELPCPELLGPSLVSKTRDMVPDAIKRAEGCTDEATDKNC